MGSLQCTMLEKCSVKLTKKKTLLGRISLQENLTHMCMHGYIWGIYLVNIVLILVFMGKYGYTWVYFGIYGCIWVYMDTYGYVLVYGSNFPGGIFFQNLSFFSQV